MKALILVLTLFTVTSVAQEPDSWRGLVLDEATPETAIAVLGKPKAEKKEDRFMSYRNKIIRDLKDLRILHWEKTEGFEDVKLYFTGGTLAIIQLEKPEKKIPAKVFADAYSGVSFEPAPRASSSAYYEMDAVTPRSIITAGIGNVTGSVSSGLFGSAGKSGQVRRLEGNVIQIFIQSRRVDDRRGLDALK